MFPESIASPLPAVKRAPSSSAALPAELASILWDASLRGRETIRLSYLRRMADFRPEVVRAALREAEGLGLRVL